ELLAVVEESDLVADPTSAEAVNVREFRRLYEWEECLPRALVEETARVTTLAEQEWAEARRRSDYARFRPWLGRLVALCREHAAAVDPDADPYDVLLRYYEANLTTAQLADLFAALRGELVPLAEAIAGARRRPNVAVLGRRF